MTDPFSKKKIKELEKRQKEFIAHVRSRERELKLMEAGVIGFPEERDFVDLQQRKLKELRQAETAGDTMIKALKNRPTETPVK